MPNDFPPWQAVYQQTRRWIAAGVLTAIIADLRELIRIGEGRAAQPSAIIVDSRTLQSMPESGVRSGCDGAKRRKGSKIHLAVDTLGQLLLRRWVIERDFGWMSRFRRLARDQERLAAVLKGFHLIAFTMLMWKQVLPILTVL